MYTHEWKIVQITLSMHNILYINKYILRRNANPIASMKALDHSGLIVNNAQW